jgi:hypothetical protein
MVGLEIRLLKQESTYLIEMRLLMVKLQDQLKTLALIRALFLQQGSLLFSTEVGTFSIKFLYCSIFLTWLPLLLLSPIFQWYTLKFT